MSRLDRESLERMPKVELHVHLEGAIPRPALDELARKYGDPPFRDLLDGTKSYPLGHKSSFADFVGVWLKIGGLLREYEDYTFIARALAGEFKRQNILYAEVLFSPARDSTAHLRPERVTEAVAAGFAQGPGDPSVRLIADFVRDNGPAEADKALSALIEMKNPLLAGIGIGGSEAPFPPAPFAPVFENARAAGLRTQAHAGESAGPESVWGAIRALKVDRIAHGVRAREDAALMSYLERTGRPLDVCPTSNIRTGAFESLSDHPAADFLRRGLRVSLSTDDPTLFGADLAGEFDALVGTFALTKDEVRTLLLHGVDAAWCGPEKKKSLRGEITRFFNA
jgi:adenosine deaminase